MVRLAVALFALIIGTSQASTNQSGNVIYGNRTVTEIPHQTAIQKGPALAKSRIPKPKLFRSNPHRLGHFALIDDQDDIFIDDDNLVTGYRRRDLGKIDQRKIAPLPDHIRWRLFLARQLALLKYKEIHG